MANETQITLIGNLVDDPITRFTQSGKPVANFTVASTPRTFDRQANEWRDGDALFLQCSVWNQYAENVTETLRKGMRVIVHGDLAARQYEHDGQKRTAYEVRVNEVGPALRYATAVVTKSASGGASAPSGQWGRDGDWDYNKPKQQPAADPWGNQSTQAPF